MSHEELAACTPGSVHCGKQERDCEPGVRGPCHDDPCCHLLGILEPHLLRAYPVLTGES